MKNKVTHLKHQALNAICPVAQMKALGELDVLVSGDHTPHRRFHAHYNGGQHDLLDGGVWKTRAALAAKRASGMHI